MQQAAPINCWLAVAVHSASPSVKDVHNRTWVSHLLAGHEAELVLLVAPAHPQEQHIRLLQHSLYTTRPRTQHRICRNMVVSLPLHLGSTLYTTIILCWMAANICVNVCILSLAHGFTRNVLRCSSRVVAAVSCYWRVYTSALSTGNPATHRVVRRSRVQEAVDGGEVLPPL